MQTRSASPLSVTQWSANLAQQLLTRNGIVMRETAAAENVPRGYSSVYPALKTTEERGWIRAFWGNSENNRQARFYELTASGRKQMAEEKENWLRLSGAVARIVGI